MIIHGAGRCVTGVVAQPSRLSVISLVATKLVNAGTSFERIVVESSFDNVVAVTSAQCVLPFHTSQGIIPRAAIEDVRQNRACDSIRSAIEVGA
jgi:hypothetical protein